MDPPHRTSSLRTSPSGQSHHQLQNPFTATNPEPSGLHPGAPRGFARRGHSDGDLGSGDVVSPRRHGNTIADVETSWMNFLRNTTERQDSTQGASELAARRRAMMIEDRRRMLSAQIAAQTQGSPHNLPLGQQLHSPPPRMPTQFLDGHAPSRHSDNPRNPFSLNLMDRPLPQRPNERTISDGRTREIKLPRWQPDEEISECPICRTTFTFWYRKHHCRKCGRVVCASCSPHRITIPRQFIVNPPEIHPSSPGSQNNRTLDLVDLTGDDNEGEQTRPPSNEQRPQSSDYKIDPALGGGQEVRLCNPCVPDPNPLPHIPSQSPNEPRSHSPPRPQRLIFSERRRPGIIQRQPLDSPLPALPNRPAAQSHEAYRPTNVTTPLGDNLNLPTLTPRRRYSHVPTSSVPTMPPSSLPTLYSSGSNPLDQQRALEGVVHRHHPSYQRHRQHGSMGPVSTTSRTFHIPEFQPAAPRQVTHPPLREEDECPVCHLALPPKGPDGSEVEREAHVAACVEERFSTSVPRASRPAPSVAIEAAVAASVATSSQASGRPISITAANSHRDSVTSQDAYHQSSFPARRRTTGMVTYNATEKDAVGEDGGGAAECVICFEEFAVGDEMGRLECLCKFHSKCIRQWWETKGPGACPVHQEGT